MQLVQPLLGKDHSWEPWGALRLRNVGTNPMVLGYHVCWAWQQVHFCPCCLTFTTKQRKHFTEEVT